MSKIIHHPRRGQMVVIKRGPLKGVSFRVIDFMEAQHQGKAIKNIKSPLFFDLQRRKQPVDKDVVFGKFFPSMHHGLVHDSELRSDGEEEVKATPLTPEQVARTSDPTKAKVLDIRTPAKSRQRKNKDRSKDNVQ